MKAATLTALTDSRRKGETIVLATNLDTGEEHLFGPSGFEGSALARAAGKAATLDQGSVVEIDGATWFLNVFNTPPALYIIGAVHIAQPLSQIAALAGFTVTVIDPRAAFASVERFPNLHLINAWADEALAELPLDSRTAVVTLTHDPKLDDPALIAALRSPCFYIGALGSRKTHAARGERMKAAGFTDADIARIHGPVGLRIGAVSPAEIAISIMAELVQHLRTPAAP